ncbi:MAG: hypothetical protein WCQ53_08795, partial [bacterium]
MRKFLILSLLLAAYPLCAQTTELMKQLSDIMKERAIVRSSSEEYTKNTLRLEDVVASLDNYETILTPKNQLNLYDAKRALYNDWVYRNNLKPYDAEELKRTLITYITREYNWEKGNETKIDLAKLVKFSMDAIVAKKENQLDPLDVVIEAKIFPYYVEKLSKDYVFKSNVDDIMFVASMQAVILTNLRTISNAAVDINDLIDYSEQFTKIIELGRPTSSELKVEKNKIIRDVIT